MFIKVFVLIMPINSKKKKKLWDIELGSIILSKVQNSPQQKIKFKNSLTQKTFSELSHILALMNCMCQLCFTWMN